MSKQTEALKLALEALELHGKQYPHMVKGYCLDAITAIREALAEQPAQQQEPVAWIPITEWRWNNNAGTWEGLPITSQPASKPLTDEHCTWKQHDDIHMPDTWEADCGAMWTFTEGGPKDNDMHYCPKCGKPAIEAKLREKNA